MVHSQPCAYAGVLRVPSACAEPQSALCFGAPGNGDCHTARALYSGPGTPPSRSHCGYVLLSQHLYRGCNVSHACDTHVSAWKTHTLSLSPSHSPHFRWLCPLTLCSTAQLQEALPARGEKVLSGWSCAACPQVPHIHTYKKRRKKRDSAGGGGGGVASTFPSPVHAWGNDKWLLWKRHRLNNEENSLSDKNQPCVEKKKFLNKYSGRTLRRRSHLYCKM